MGLTEKILAALRERLPVEYARLEDDDGVSGFVVSEGFVGMSPLDRQKLIDDALRSAKEPLKKSEQRQILMIAGVTPTEYESVGVPIRVQCIPTEQEGSFEILVHGGSSDVSYVQGVFKGQKGVKFAKPQSSTTATGTLISFEVKGTKGSPLSKARVLRVLESDPYIQVLQDVVANR